MPDQVDYSLFQWNGCELTTCLYMFYRYTVFATKNNIMTESLMSHLFRPEKDDDQGSNSGWPTYSPRKLYFFICTILEKIRSKYEQNGEKRKRPGVISDQLEEDPFSENEFKKAVYKSLLGFRQDDDSSSVIIPSQLGWRRKIEIGKFVVVECKHLLNYRIGDTYLEENTESNDRKKRKQDSNRREKDDFAVKFLHKQTATHAQTVAKVLMTKVIVHHSIGSDKELTLDNVDEILHGESYSLLEERVDDKFCFDEVIFIDVADSVRWINSVKREIKSGKVHQRTGRTFLQVVNHFQFILEEKGDIPFQCHRSFLNSMVLGGMTHWHCAYIVIPRHKYQLALSKKCNYKESADFINFMS